MRWKTIKNLFLTNLMYINPIQTAKYRKKYKGTVDIRKKVFNNQLLLIGLNIFIFYMLFNSIFNAVVSGPLYKYVILFLFVMSALTLSTTFLNMFYESKDTNSLTPLPISEKELFIGKFLVLLFQLSGIFIPVVVINFIVSTSNGFSLLSVLIALIYSICIIVIISGILILLLSTITYIPNFEKNKNKINGVIIFLGFGIGFGYYALSQFLVGNESFAENQIYKGDFFFDILSKNAYYNLLILVIIAIFITFLVNKFVAKKYIDDIHRISNISSSTINSKKREKKERSIKNTTLQKKLIIRNIKLFSHGTLIANILSNYLFTIVIFTGAIINIRREGGFPYGIELYPFAICFSSSIAILMMLNPISFTGVAISVEKQDYYHLKSLPIDFKKYLKLKLRVSSTVQIFLGLAILLIMLILSKVHISLILVAVVSFVVSSIILAIHSYIRDFNKLYLNWNNILELSNRGGSQLIIGILGFLVFTGIIALNGITIFLLLSYPIFTHILGGLYSILLIILLVISSTRLKKQVFDKII